LAQHIESFTERIPWPVALDVGFCFYETSLATVKRAIESVKDHVRYIFAIDGKFEFFESENDLSSKAVRDYLVSVDNVILTDYPNRKENEKRQQYLDFAMDLMSDWLLILDADEFITDETNWDEAYNHMKQLFDHEALPKTFGVTIRHGNKEGYYPRLWRRPYLIRYMRTHNFWKYADGTIWKSTVTNPPIKSIYMRGNDKDRDPEYVKKTYEYQLKLMKYEKPFKEEYRKTAQNTRVRSGFDPRLPGIPLS